MKNLNEVLQNDKKAKEFFMTLDEGMQGGMTQLTDSIHSYEDMVDFVEKHKKLSF